RAVAALPGEVAVAINYADSLCSRGSHDEAVMALGDWPDTSAAASNALGNVLALMRELDRATSAYRHAVDLAGDSSEVVDYLVNLGAVLVEQGDMSEAEEALRKALERRSDARALMLMGDLATEYGDTGRAELAYRAALEDTPEDAAILGRIVNHYVMRRKFDKAERHLPALERTDPKAAAAARARIRDATIETIACASCGLSWDVPKPTPAAPRATLRGEPPDSSPAGSCPSCGSVYCVACRKEHLVDGRFTCPVCGTRLNLNDNRIRWLVYEAVRNQSSLQEPDKHSR
ncbi:MAG: tetratricopeptide repeat protein, partial [Spirochaetales bacterium]|nr:tetratricopeptide repeat protein [Spirochaetales bacterium]